MKPAVWEYPAPDKRTVYFRGYVKVYQGATLIRVPCEEVHQNKWKAKAEAERLIKKLKKQYDN